MCAKLLPQIKSHLPRQLRITSSDTKLLHLLELMHTEDSSILPASFAELGPPHRILQFKELMPKQGRGTLGAQSRVRKQVETPA